jgi:hypothetical protein
VLVTREEEGTGICVGAYLMVKAGDGDDELGLSIAVTLAHARRKELTCGIVTGQTPGKWSVLGGETPESPALLAPSVRRSMATITRRISRAGDFERRGR